MKIICKNGIDYSLCIIFMNFIPNGLCSLLSRLKNRYEYLPQHNNTYTFTDDLYDFEFTNIPHSSLNLDAKKNYDILLHPDYDLRIKKIDHSSQSIDTNSYTRNDVKDHRWSDTSYDAFSYRPTVNFSIITATTTIKRRKTWATYFPRKTITEKGSSATRTQENTEHFSFSISAKSLHTNQEDKTSTFITTRKGIPMRMSHTSMIMNIKNMSVKINTEINFFQKNIIRQSVRSRCYRCGLNESKIPMPYCYNTFTGSDQRFSRRKNRFKVKCIRSRQAKKVKNTYYGPWFRRGCFKRFLDVGTEYDERGCRTFKPMKGKSFASTRFVKLEALLNKVEDGCIFSPHSSLTPFSRAISLYARYHVCVCSQKYCNECNSIYAACLYSYFVLFLYTIVYNNIVSYILS